MFTVELVPGPSSVNTKVPQTRLTIPSFSRVSDRYGVPDRAAAALAYALLYDIKTSTPPDSNENNIIIDKYKVRRERTIARNEVMSKISNNDCNLRALYFDGIIDDTLCIDKTKDGKMHRTSVKEDHISLIHEPNSQFLGCTTPLTGKAG